MKIFKVRFAKKETQASGARGKKNKMVVIHRKQLMAVAFMLLIGAVGYMNWTLQNNTADPDVAVMYQEASKKIGEAQMVNAEPTEAESFEKKENDYFVKARVERETKRSEAIEMLSELVKTQNADAKAKENAEREIHQMAEFTEKETMAENMIRAKGFREAVVFMNETVVSVAVESKGLNEVDAAQIRDIVVSATNCTPDQIRIVEIAMK